MRRAAKAIVEAEQLAEGYLRCAPARRSFDFTPSVALRILGFNFDDFARFGVPRLWEGPFLTRNLRFFAG